MENKTRENRYVTHVLVDEFPLQGVKKVYFYTSDVKELSLERDYFWGTDNNSFDHDHMLELVRQGTLLPLPESLLLEQGKTLWLDAFGKVYHADVRKPYPLPTKHVLEMKKIKNK